MPVGLPSPDERQVVFADIRGRVLREGLNNIEYQLVGVVAVILVLDRVAVDTRRLDPCAVELGRVALEDRLLGDYVFRRHHL